MKVLTFITSSFLLLGAYQAALAQVGELTPYVSFQGVLLDSSNNPITVSTAVDFEIYNPAGSCLLYRETQNVTPSSSGAFSVFIGSAPGNAKRNGADPGLSWKNIFQNSTALTGASACSYNPLPGDSRSLKVIVAGTALTPNFNLAAVPTATVSETLQGRIPSDFLSPHAASNLDQTNLQSIFAGGNFSVLSSLIAGTSTLYTKADGSNFSPSAPFSVNNQRITNLVSPTSGTDAVNKTYADTNIGGKASSGLGALSAGDNGKVLQWDGAQWIATTASATDATKLPLTGGTLSGGLNLSLNAINNVGALSVGVASPHASAVADFSSSTQGLLIPRMTGPSITAISSPAAGLQVYNTTTNQLNYYDGTAWQAVGASGSGLSSLNGETSSTQSLATGTSALAPNWTSSAGVHTLNIPMASTAGVTGGLISKAEYDSFAAKIENAGGTPSIQSGILSSRPAFGTAGRLYVSTDEGKIYRDSGASWDLIGGGGSVVGASLNSGQIWIGSGSNQAAAVPVSGDISISNAGVTAINTGAVGTSKIADSSITLSKLAGGLSSDSLVISGMTGLTTIPCSIGKFPQVGGGTIAGCSAFSLPTSTGSSGDILIGNGAGATSWVTPNWINGTDAFSNTSVSQGISVSGNLIRLHAASDIMPGAVSTVAQTFAGTKTFEDPVFIGMGAGSNMQMLQVDGRAFIRTNDSGAPVALTVTNLNGGMSGSAIEFEGNNSGAPKPLVRLAGLQETLSEGTFTIDTFDGVAYIPRVRVKPDGRVGIGTVSPMGALDIQSSNGALIPPRVSQTQRASVIAVPGGVIYNTDTNRLEIFNGTAWQPVNGGISTCPGGYSRVGTVGQPGSFCISTSENSTQTWVSAANFCSTQGANLCSTQQWVRACATAGSAVPAISNIDNGTTVEMLGEVSGANVVTAGTNASCEGFGTTTMATSTAFRCCID